MVLTKKHYNNNKIVKKHNKTIVQDGGLFIGHNKNAELYFKHFIKNSTFEFLSRGAFGLTFIATLKHGIESPYLHMDINNFNEPVQKILIKLSFMHNDDKQRYKNIKLGFKIDNIECLATHHNNFEKEVNIQTEIYFKTYKYLQPICPAILFSSIETIHGDNVMLINEEIDSKQVETKLSCNYLLSSMITNASEDKVIEYLLEIYKNYSNGNIGIIAMEYADVYMPLSQIYILGDYERALIVKFMLINLFLETGYIHADFNDNNILVKTKDNTFLDGIPYSFLLIDFGYVVKANSEELHTARELLAKKDYLGIIRIICDCKMFGEGGLHALDLYKYICNPHYYYSKKHYITKTEFIDIQTMLLEDIFRRREISIEKNINNFNTKHSKNPEKYPLLPLDNSIKKKLYNGFIYDNTGSVNAK